MRLHLVSLSFATLLPSVTYPFISPPLTVSPLVAQAQTPQARKAEGERLLEEGIEQEDAQQSNALADRQHTLKPRRSNCRGYLGALRQPLAIASDSVQNHLSPFAGWMMVDL